MTAEVAILNKSAIAVAADSAITVGKNKVHRTANKIFRACDSAPIGAMVYGSAELSGMPWETLIKLFRSEHGKEPYSTVQECFAKLRKFLEQRRFRTERDCDESLARFTIDIIEMVRDRIGELPEENKTEAVKRAIEEELTSYDEATEPIDFSCPQFSEFQVSANGIIRPVADEVLGDIGYEVMDDVYPYLHELVYKALNSSYMSHYSSGLVVFGFGSDELLPSLVRSQFDAVPFFSLRSKSGSVNADQGPYIIPFGNREVMDILIQGVSEHLSDFMLSSIKYIGEEIAERIIKDNLRLTKDEYTVAKSMNDKVIKKVIEDFEPEWHRYIHKKYVGKMMEVIYHMSKEDLGTIAEALVDVTALRIKASDALESVGGPIDVCVVSKGDGLIWIKRKHYFELPRNLHYLYRRFGNFGHLLDVDEGASDE